MNANPSSAYANRGRTGAFALFTVNVAELLNDPEAAMMLVTPDPTAVTEPADVPFPTVAIVGSEVVHVALCVTSWVLPLVNTSDADSCVVPAC